MAIDWDKLMADFKAQADAQRDDLAARRRDFLKSVGLNRAIIRKHRLRPQDGLSEEAWWAAARVAMKSQQVHGAGKFGKAVGK